MYKGRVTHRVSGAPLENVLVSDGKNIVRSDADGRFELEGWERAHLIYVNLLTSVDDDWYIKIDDRIEQYDFAVTPAQTGEDFCFLHTSDTEIANIPFVEWLPFCRENVAKHKPAFFVNTGDLCHDFGMRRHKLIMNRETFGCPVRYTIGNHDFTGADYGEQSYENYMGPVWYSFDCANVHFIVTSIGKGDKPTGFDPQDQWVWVKNDLALLEEGKKVVVFNHDICPVDETRYRVTVGEVDIDFREHGIIAWAFGHFHSHFINEHDGVLNIGTACADTGGIDSSVAGIRKVTISNGKVSSEVIPFRNEVEAADAAVWSTDLGAYSEYCSPISYNGDVIAATVDNGYPKKCGVYRLNGENGEIKWSFKTRNSVCNDMAIDGGCLYLQDTQLRLYCLDVESGELLWHVDMENIVRPMYSRMNVLIVDDVVIGGSQYMLYAFNKKSGELVWKYAAEKVCEPSPALLLHDKKRNQLILSRHWKDLRALDLDTREVKWSHKDDMMFFRTATPLISEDIIYTCGLRKLHKFDIETGELLVCADAPCVMDVGGSPALDGDVIYYPTATMGVIAFELPSFRQLRRFETENVGVVSSPYRYGRMQTVEPTPRIFGDTLVFASNDGCVYFYNKETAELERKICVGSPILSSPIFEDGYMTVLDFDGRVSKFKL